MLYRDQVRYIPIAKKWASKYKLPPELVLGIIGVESAFNPKAYRSEPHIADASYGLMQILSRTAQGLGFKPAPFSITHPLFDPDTNIKWGTAFLKTLWDRYGGNVDDVIAAYNMGFPRKASATTPHIIKIYGAPEQWWTYANQPYVDNVKRHMAYFRAYLKGDTKEAEKYEKAIRDLWAKRKKPIAPLILPILLILPWILRK